MRRAAASDKISLKQDTDSLWGCVCCAVAIATHVREVRRLQRGRKTICHDIPSAPGLSSLTQRHQRAPVPIPALVPVLCFCCTASQIYFSNENWKKKKRKIFEVRKKKSNCVNWERAFSSLRPPPLGIFATLVEFRVFQLLVQLPHSVANQWR